MKTSDEVFDDLIRLLRQRTAFQKEVIAIENQITAIDQERQEALVREGGEISS